ncbi:MAG: hypothetical protein HYT48_01265 [Candidatus Vogelbacteria bacterium]|nr:hypothetical protein [Candidatus Vogelbacteria bacterium]
MLAYFHDRRIVLTFKKEMRKIRKLRSPTKQKIILLLTGGALLGLTRSPGNYFRVAKRIARAWKDINRRDLINTVKEFRHNRLVDFEEQSDGTIKIVITEKGKLTAIRINMDQMKIKKPARWDGRWRLVIFDIPEHYRNVRDALREKLKEIGFREIQKSTFVFPYPCTDEINFLMEFFEVRSCVRLAEVVKITNEEELLLNFGLHK